jgi:hypothetical protein
MRNLWIILAVLSAAALATAQTGTAGHSGWLLERAGSEESTLQRATLHQSDIGGSYGGGGYADVNHTSLLKPILLSALVPGLGEASMGYKRGYAMIALDLASWFGVKHYHDLGGEKRDDYIAFAEAHWSETELAEAFGGDEILDSGTFYYGTTMDDDEDYTTLSLWVSREDDYREYYENLGKWDQFVFGWDDFKDPRDLGVTIGENRTSYLKDDPRVSENRIVYRGMRADSNEAFDRRDFTMLFAILNRAVSVFDAVRGAGGDHIIELGGLGVELAPRKVLGQASTACVVTGRF